MSLSKVAKTELFPHQSWSDSIIPRVIKTKIFCSYSTYFTVHLLLITILSQNILLRILRYLKVLQFCQLLHISGNQDIWMLFLSLTTSSLHKGLIYSISTLGFTGCEVCTQFLPLTHFHTSVCCFVFSLFYLEKLVQFCVNHRQCMVSKL